MAKPTRALLQARKDTQTLLAEEKQREGRIVELEAQVKQMGEQLVASGEALNNVRRLYSQSIEERDSARNQAGDAIAENANLRDELHRMTIENARLQGQLDRVREFDPVSERRLYEDDLPRRSRSTAEEAADAYLVSRGGQRRPSWYRRG